MRARVKYCPCFLRHMRRTGLPGLAEFDVSGAVFR